MYAIERKNIDEIFALVNIKVQYLSLERTYKRRSDEIIWYLNKHPEINKYVILDDNDLGYSNNQTLNKHFIDTFPDGINPTMFNIIIDVINNKR